MFDYLQILANERLKSWKIVWETGGGLCLYEKKEIWMGDDKDDIALFLHEVAHAKCKDKGPKHWHDVFWADKFTNLVRKYMDGIESES